MIETILAFFLLRRLRGNQGCLCALKVVEGPHDLLLLLVKFIVELLQVSPIQQTHYILFILFVIFQNLSIFDIPLLFQLFGH